MLRLEKRFKNRGRKDVVVQGGIKETTLLFGFAISRPIFVLFCEFCTTLYHPLIGNFFGDFTEQFLTPPEICWQFYLVFKDVRFLSVTSKLAEKLYSVKDKVYSVSINDRNTMYETKAAS